MENVGGNSKKGGSASFLPYIEVNHDWNRRSSGRTNLQAAISRGSSLGSGGSSAYSSRSNLSSVSSLCSNCRAVCRLCSRNMGPKYGSKGRVEEGAGKAVDDEIKNGGAHGCKRCGYVDSPLFAEGGDAEEKTDPRCNDATPLILKISSPLHSYGKQRWIDMLVDPKTTSLPMSALPPIKEHQQQLNGNTSKDHFKKDKGIQSTTKLPLCTRKVKPCTPKLKKPQPLGHQLPSLGIKGAVNKVHIAVPSSKSTIPNSAPPPSQEGNTLPLVYNRHVQRMVNVEPLPGSIFSQCPEPGGWFVVHPDWRLEPGIKGMWSL